MQRRGENHCELYDIARTIVKQGGHHIADDVVIRRYDRGISNLINLYMPVCDKTIVVDNRADTPILIAENNLGDDLNILKPYIWNKIKNHGN